MNKKTDNYGQGNNGLNCLTLKKKIELIMTET